MAVTAYGAASHEGAVRQVNEDNFRAMPDIGLFAVADGMGGHRGGRTASRITVENLTAYIQEGRSLGWAVEAIHHDILAAAAADPELNGMGSTVVAMKIKNHRYEIIWVGDSRAYSWDGATLRRLTRDHSYVQYLLDEGHITAGEIPDHPQRNIILQALGAHDMEEVAPDLVSGVFREKEIILLCSDGLTSEVDDIGIAEILSRETALQDAADHLVAAAIDGGGSDNITVILVAAPESVGTEENLLADTEIMDIAETITVIDDSEDTEPDGTAFTDGPDGKAFADLEKTAVEEAPIFPENASGDGTHDREITQIEKNTGGHLSGDGPAAGPGASPLKTFCWVLAALAAFIAIAIGLIHLP